MPDRKKKRYDEIEAAGKQITSLLRDCQTYFRASDHSEPWEKYLSFLDDVIVNGLLKMVACSLGYFIDETDQTLTNGPLFEVT